MNEEAAKALRAPFPPEAIGKLPRGGTQLDYVGHGAVTDRLLQVDPEWSWEPLAFDADGTPLVRYRDGDAVMWIRLTIAGMTRFGVGIVNATAFELEKQLISDALRNAAMRFGVALDLWSKEVILPPAEPTVTKPQVDAFNKSLGEVSDDVRIPFLEWKTQQGFEWPWTVDALKAMEAKLAEIVAAGDVPASPAAHDVGESDKPDDPPGSSGGPTATPQPALSDADVTLSGRTVVDGHDLAEYSEEAF